MKVYLKLMSTKTKWKCVGITLLAAISSVLASVWPVRLGELYTEISRGGNVSVKKILMATVTFGLIYLSAECVAILRRVLMDCIIAAHEAEIREKSVEKLLKMPVSFYEGSLSGEKTAQLNQGVSGFSQLLKIVCNDVFSTILVAFCTLVQVWANAPEIMAGVMMCYLIVTISISVFQIRSQNGIRESIIRKKNGLDGQICQSIGNLELIRSMDAGEYEKTRLQPVIKDISSTEKRHHCYMGSFDCLKQASKIIFQVIVLLGSVYLIGKGRMETGAVITVCLLFQQLVKPIDEVYRFMDETAASLIKAEVLVKVLDSGEDPIFSVEGGREETEKKDIVIKNVVITNPEKDMELAHYEKLTIPCNDIVALCGESGSGKTTLTRCLTRFYPYVKGRVRVFGKDIDLYSQKELTDKLFYMPQKAFFFAGSIRENLVYGLNREISDVELLTALRKACLLDVLIQKVKNSDGMKCKDILSYEIGEGGKGLSGGEGQRLSIARAFLRKPMVYIFDESTANLDASTAEKVLDNMEEYAKEIDAGIIYISHDEKVVSRCKKVINIVNKTKLVPQEKAA